MSENNINVPQNGMSFTNKSQLKEGQYSLLVNGNLQNTSGNFALITNDQSNILSSRFKDGYKVIGSLIVPSLSLTFFFLTNPSTNDSEIGWILDAHNTDVPNLAIDCSDCNKPILESTPLEETIQNPTSVYNTFVNARCLNFDIDHPISSWVKVDDCNVRIYFNDFKSPPRYIDYKNFPKVNLSNCPLIETQDLDCDKIQIFPQTCYPSVEVVDIISGGKNEAGVYQFVLCYSDVNSNKITDYFFVSNPTPLFDKPITIPTNYPVAKSFKIEITNLNTDFKYFNLVVIKTINNVTTPYLVETFEVRNTTFTYVYTGVDRNIQQNLSIDEILGKRPYYNKAKGITESDGYSFQWNLEEDRILNLQPVINNIKPFWQTVEMNEGDYKNPILAQNYVGFLGDETYPLGISFTKTTGKSTNVFSFIGRDKTLSDIEDVSLINGLPNPDVISGSACGTGENPNLRWQVYNTASITGESNCVDFDNTELPEQITEEVECYSEFILMNSISSVDANGNPIYTQTPKFYLQPPTGIICNTPTPQGEIVYPATTSLDVDHLTNCYLEAAPYSTQLQNLLTDPNIQALIGLCECSKNNPTFAPYLDQDANAIITTIPLQLDPFNINTSVEVLTEEVIFPVNTYSTTGEVPKALIYPSTPNPCKNFADEDDDAEKGWQGWLDQKQNSTPASPDSLSQSYDTNCNSDTWGSFISGKDANDNLHTDSWYTFYCTNQDGVAAILLSTNNNNFTIDVYGSNTDGSINLGNQIGLTSTTNYTLVKGLNYGSQYYVNVGGKYPIPTAVSGIVDSSKCKERVFRICIANPGIESTEYQIMPALVQIIKTCQVTYKGFPEKNCKPKPKEYGEFAYWESQETYPCNEEVYGNLAGKPIRHFKFPDHNVTPFFKETGAVINNLSLRLNKIYPKGISVDITQIKLALETAVVKGLITDEEKNQICGYRIHRGNRRGNPIHHKVNLYLL